MRNPPRVTSSKQDVFITQEITRILRAISGTTYMFSRISQPDPVEEHQHTVCSGRTEPARSPLRPQSRERAVEMLLPSPAWKQGSPNPDSSNPGPRLHTMRPQVLLRRARCMDVVVSAAGVSLRMHQRLVVFVPNLHLHRHCSRCKGSSRGRTWCTSQDMGFDVDPYKQRDLGVRGDLLVQTWCPGVASDTTAPRLALPEGPLQQKSSGGQLRGWPCP